MIGRMNNEWALLQLDEFIALTSLYQPPPTPGIVFIGDDRNTRGSEEQIVASAQVVEQVLTHVLPLWCQEIAGDTSGRWQQHHQAARRAVVSIHRAAEVAENLGENAPTLNAAGFHPWAWEGARSLWQSGHYREAVRSATVKINAELQNKVGIRSTSETALFQLVFSNDPARGTTLRLRPAGDDGGKTSLSVRRGIVALAEACYGAIRNPASHDEGETAEQVALEQLATLSVLARAVDEATIDRG
ncbi:restriction endonuclease [Cryobacterium sp. MDB2-33-2]|nr:restriction endonuclease [Cryobacterium sp. MDB2-33-2]